MLYRIIYTSKSTRHVTDDDLDEILTTARTNNPAHGLTGVLLYNDGVFLQVLEGERSDVETLLGKIKGDPRNKEVDVCFEDIGVDRIFTDWSMAYVPLSPDLQKKLAGEGDFSSALTASDDDTVSKTIITQFLSHIIDEMIADKSSPAT